MPQSTNRESRQEFNILNTKYKNASVCQLKALTESATKRMLENILGLRDTTLIYYGRRYLFHHEHYSSPRLYIETFEKELGKLVFDFIMNTLIRRNWLFQFKLQFMNVF